MASQRSFFSRRIHSLLGVIPVGFFLVEHLFTNYYATQGAKKFVDQVEWLWGLPFLPVLEIVFIFIPLLYHGGYGLYIALQAKNNLTTYSTFRNVLFTLQRVTGVIALVFICWHLWDTRVQVLIKGYSAVDLARETSMILQNPVNLTLYIIAIIATVFHFSNGLWSFFVSWGVTIGPRSQLISTYVLGVVFVVVSYLGVKAALSFANINFIQQLTQ